SMATTFSTLLPVLALLLFGGQTLKDFAFALLVGIASGAYSSIFIASPVLTHWKEREPVYIARRRRIASPHGGLVPAYATGRAGAVPGGSDERAHAAEGRGSSREGQLDGRTRLGDDGPRDLALHDLPAGPLVGRHRRRVCRRRHRRLRLRRDRQRPRDPGGE